MSQQDCLEWLQEQHKSNPDKWFRVKDVQDGLREQGKGNGTIKNVSQHLFCLISWGDIEWRGIGAWKHYKEFRFKE